MPYALMWSSTVIFIGYPMSSAMEVVWLDVPPLLAPALDEPGATQRRTATVALLVGVRGPNVCQPRELAAYNCLINNFQLMQKHLQALQLR
jgi:hypothetical protein